ncbi:MAG: PQQ-binding-like beta-propeller repeat protein, partial [Vicinamibacterales bacterium]|nr:PQQ-binding-like beta-propeller repeat protein [Vicinamibacterales bacterium]
MRNTNRRVTLAARPTGFPKPSDFALVEDPIPEPGPGQVLVRNHYLSLDPYMRGRMNDVKSYVPPVQIGETMVGATAGEVTQSNAPGLAVGDFVMVPGGWQDYSVASAAEALKLDAEAAPISTGLGALGMPGMTAYFGLLDLGQPKPGDTVFVSAKDYNTVYALDAADGSEKWHYRAGGQVDSPPSILGDLVLFGSADGWIYCLHADDGRLVWRFRAAPTSQMIVV